MRSGFHLPATAAMRARTHHRHAHACTHAPEAFTETSRIRGIQDPTAIPAHICIATGLTPAHICIATGLSPAHICTGTALHCRYLADVR
jgi:hypothetical protein